MPLSVSIISPTAGSVIAGPAPLIAPTATVSSTHPVASVKFYNASALIGETGPLITTYDPVITGLVALTDGLPTVNGTTTTFTTDFVAGDYVVFASQPTNIYRIQSITSDILLTLSTPFTGTTVGSVTMRSVSLFPSFSVAWVNVNPGSYSLRAVVTDILGATATSSTVAITVSGVITGLPSTALAGSSIGFGRNPFGQHQFGFGDWAEQMLWGNLPQFYKDCDEAGPTGSVVQQPLRKFQDALKPAYQELRIRWHEFTYLWDAIRVPLDQLPQLGYNVGITVDPTKAAGLQRSSVLNASQLWINKGTDKGYQLTAAFEGLLATITPLWAKTCGPATTLLGTIGAISSSFDLATKLVGPRPVSPGTLHLKVTTNYGIVEDIYDDEAGGLFGVGNPLNGPLTRLNTTGAFSLTLTLITGLFSVGDTVTQGANSGTVLAVIGSRIVVVPTVGSFSTGPIVDTTSAATATVTIVSADLPALGEVVVGESSGTTAEILDFRTSYAIVDRITTAAGFTPGETIRGLTSNNYTVAGTSTPLIQGPLRALLSVSAVVGAFTINDQVVGGTSGAIGFIREIDGSSLYADTITQPGFSVGETISIGGNSAVIDSITFGSIDYVIGQMQGHTVALQAGSTINSVVDLLTTGPTQFLPAFDEVLGDEIPMDLVETDRYARWPITYRPVRIVNGILTDGECRSYSCRLFFQTPDDTEIEDFENVSGRIRLALEQFRPVHVRFDKISFDGAHASSQVWRTGAIVAESYAASVWTSSVVGNQQASSQVWTTGPFTATVAT